MDLFNKKKLEDMTIHLAEVMQDRNKWEKAYTNQVKDTNKLLEENKNLIQENQKLIDWIEKILNEVGIKTKDSYEGQIITIPYYEEIKPYCIEGDWDKASMKQKDIIIPSIKYTKLN